MKALGFLLCLVLIPFKTFAHDQSISYLSQNNEGWQLSISVEDLHRSIGLDQNTDDEITWGEVKSRWTEITRELNLSFIFSFQEVQCWNDLRDLSVNRKLNTSYIQLNFLVICTDQKEPDHLHFSFLEAMDSQHINLFAVGERQDLLRAGSRISLHEQSPIWSFSLEFLRLGIVHILVGIDHLLFLLVLLIPMFRQLMLDPYALEVNKSVFLLVTTFTLAHSLTLILTGLDIIDFPSQIAELLIAATVVYGAGNALRKNAQIVPLWIVLIFGLVHGIGFATVLSEFQVNHIPVWQSLLLFNLGVEAGQLLFILPVVVLLMILTTKRPARLAFSALSASCLVAAIFWTYERLLLVI